ncbi:MAG: NAD(P)-binding domain-containing protein, partial [Betaproteobacteria bacterium]
MSKVGFVGLGIMGAPMAGHLQAAGHALSAFTRGNVPQSLTAGSVKVCASAKEVAQSADIIITMVP